jgi:MraZ protein
MFQGASALALDAKGRLAVPARHRDVLAATAAGQLTITKHPEGCLLLFPRPEWEKFRDKVAALPMTAQGWKRIFLGYAMDVEIDAASRVLIAPELRAAASLGKDVILLGMGSHFELWDVAAHQAQEERTKAQGLPAALADFSF